MTKILILTGSNRPGRFNIQPAQWIAKEAQKHADIEVELVDLQEVALPFLDEPQSPMQRQYEHAHTKEWSARIAEADGFILVTPEYNHSFSPILKNALDYLYHEWNHKPVSFVSYGSLAGGSRAVEHLRGVAGELKMYDLREQIMFPNYWDHLDVNGSFTFTAEHQEQAQNLVASLAFWAGELKASRAKLG